MYNKLIISLAFLLFVFAGYSQESSNVTISGNFKNSTGNETVKLMRFDKTKVVVASSKINANGDFLIKAFISVVDLYRLQLSEEKFISLIIEPGEKIKIQADANNLSQSLNVSGSEQTALLYNAMIGISRYEVKLDSITKKFKVIQKSGIDMKAATRMRTDYSKINDKKTNYVTTFIYENPKSLASLFFIEKLDISKNFNIYAYLDSSLYRKYPDNAYVKNLHDRVAKERTLAIGSIAPEIILPDPDSNLIKLSSFRGKVVLIDFWAGWCGPCRRENPNLVNLYSKYKEKGFEIFGVSLDKTRASWLGAIKADNIVWTQVSDLKYWSSPSSKLYGVKSIPHTVLLDREGRIIGNKLRGKALEDKLEELLGE